MAILQAAEAALNGTQKTLQDSQGQLRDAERQLGDTAADLQSSEAPQGLAFALLMASSLTAAMPFHFHLAYSARSVGCMCQGAVLGLCGVS